MRHLCSIYFIFFGLYFNLNAQDTINFKQVEILSNKIKPYNYSIQIDSNLKTLLQGRNFTSLLSSQVSSNFKQYGPNGLSSVSLRGGSPSQTNLLWNQLIINQSTNGQFDVNTIPLFLIGSVSFNPVSENISIGQGNINGQIQINSFNATKNEMMMQYSAYNAFQIGLRYHFKFKKTSLHQALVLENSKNQFQFYNSNFNRIQKALASDNQILGYVFDINCNRFKNAQIIVNQLFTYYNRTLLPNIYSINGYRNIQKDISEKLNIELKVKNKPYQLKYQFGTIYDKLIFNQVQNDSKDSTSSINFQQVFSLSKSISNRFNLGLQISQFYQIAQSNLYIKQAQSFRNHTSMYSLITHKNLKIVPSIKFIHDLNFNKLRNYVLPSFKCTYQKHQHLKFILNYSKNIRFPTFNDQYWKDGGIRDLEPEKSNIIDLSTLYQNKIIQLNFNGFYNQIYNWIQWVPNGNQTFSPRNIKSVNSKGFESYMSIILKYKKIKLIPKLNYAFNQVQTISSDIKNDLSINKQLIFTPLHKINLNIFFMYHNLSVYLNQSFIGKQLISSDASNQLDPIYYLDAGMSINYKIAKLSISYLNMAHQYSTSSPGYPMPLNNFNLNLSFNI